MSEIPVITAPDPVVVTKEELLERIKIEPKIGFVPGIGNVRYRTLSFEEQYKLRAFAGDALDYSARAILEGCIEPHFEEADLPALKSGLFGPVSKLAALPLSEFGGNVFENAVGKPTTPLVKTES